MPANCTVSILIPCRNAAAWLRACVESAFAQTHPAIEVIVYDDGSTDGSLESLNGLGDERLKTLQGPGEGGNVARNRLLAVAGGEWVQYLDADDYLQPEKIAEQLAAGGDPADVDVLYSPVWEETWRDGRAAGRQCHAIDTTEDLFTQWISWQLPQTSGPLWRKASLEALGGWKPDQPCCQEHELYLRSLKARQRWRFSPTPNAVYRIWSEDTLCRRDPLKVIRMRTRLIDDLLVWLREQGHEKPVHRATAGQAFLEMARTWAKSDLDQATNYYKERKRSSGITARGPSSPINYRLALALLGFRKAESLARRLRSC